MVAAMKSAAKMAIGLTPEGKTLFYVGYKNVFRARRASLGLLSSIERKEESRERANRIKVYRLKVESELTNICYEVIDVISEHLLPGCKDEESLVYYYTMRGDHYRYLAEFKTGNDRNEAAEHSREAYEAANHFNLRRSCFLRLELAMKFSLFYNDILNLPRRAWELTDQAFEEAISEIRNLRLKPRQDSISMMQLLQEAILYFSSRAVDDAAATDAAATVADFSLIRLCCWHWK